MIDLNQEQAAIRDGVAAVCNRFGDEYWAACDRDERFPHEFHRAMAADGWLGVTMPEEYGGAGLGVTEAAIVMLTVASRGAQTAASSIDINMFGPHPVVVHGTPQQKAQWLPRLVRGEDQVCFGVTEPDAGLDTTSIKTFAKRVDGGYRVSGRKIWTSTAQEASKILLLTRTATKAAGGNDARGYGLCQGIPRRATSARSAAQSSRAGVRADDPLLHRRALPRPAKVLLRPAPTLRPETRRATENSHA